MEWLVNQFYKILPIRESNDKTLNKYLCSLQRKMLGCKSLITALNNDEYYLCLLSVLQYMIDNDCNVDIVKRDVFESINIIKKLQKKYFENGV